ncbi:MAG: vanadium-dependent haloperoxidase [Acidobacteria bacterium]|nr:vanadium-dependent haloperoxidase [Acidobacteriota bacterium]
MRSTRRNFFNQAVTAGTVAASLTGAKRKARAQTATPAVLENRLEKAYEYRVARAGHYRALGPVEHVTNGDEQRYSNRLNSFSKTLLHDQFGHVSRDAYNSMIRAVNSGKPEDFEAIIRGGNVRLKNPTGAYNYQIAGADQSQFLLKPPPAFDSPAQAAAITELYWQSLLRDVPFANFESDENVLKACRELTAMQAFTGPRINGQVTPATVFRGHTPGDLTGPYISQFLFAPFKMGHLQVDQKQISTAPGVEFMTRYSDYLTIQFGEGKGPGQTSDTVPRYVRNGRDLAHLVHVDWSFSPAYHALWMLLAMGPAAYFPGNPYVASRGQEPYINFGPPDSFEYVSRAGKPAFNAAWFQKWFIHRAARPEVMANRIHHHASKIQVYPIHDSAFSAAVETVFNKFGTYLLPQAYSEGSPPHSTYPSGHATVNGAVVTMMKALFNESFVLPDPVVPSHDGLQLLPYRGPDLTIGNELNKLAFNIAVGRNWAGIHFRYDAWEGIKLGEEVALSLLADLTAGYMDIFPGFEFTKFDGTKVKICNGCVAA